MPSSVQSSSQLTGETHQAHSDENASDAATAPATVAAAVEDLRPCEEICISEKRMSTVTNAEIEIMLNGDPPVSVSPSTSPSSQSSFSLPSKISSLQVVHNRCSLLPPSLTRLEELQSLKLHSNQFVLMEDDDDDAERQLSTGVSSVSVSSSDSIGLGRLKQLESLELIHESSPPLTANQLPTSLTALTIKNWPIHSTLFAHLSNLQSLNISHIQSFTQIPESVKVLNKLQRLSITHNPSLTTLPSSLPTSLTSLDLQHNALYSLPESLDQLTELRQLNVCNNKLIVLPRVFRTLKERGCQVRHDGIIDEEEQSSVVIEEITEKSPTVAKEIPTTSASSSSTAAHSVTSTHSSKRKKEPIDSVDLDDDSARVKHARSSTDQSTPSSTRAHSTRAREQDAEDESTSDRSLSEIDAAASATASAPPRRQPATKRKLEPEVTLLDNVDSLKKVKLDPPMVASFKYFNGELDYGDRVTTGFFDPGRRSSLFRSLDDMASLSLEDIYKLPHRSGEREIVLVDEERDVRLRKILAQARAMVKQDASIAQSASASAAAAAASSSAVTPPTRSLTELQLLVRLLACLVSDSFGGRVVVFAPPPPLQKRHQLSSSTSHTSTSELEQGSVASITQIVQRGQSQSPTLVSPLASLYSLCHAEVEWWRATTQSNVVLLCSIQHGLCRHRSILFKYLIDQLFHPSQVACKLVRGFREGGVGHAWTVVRIRQESEYLVDTLDSPHLFRPLSSMVDPNLSYYPQWAVSSSSAFTHPTTGELPETRASFRDLHLARYGKVLGTGSYSIVYECIFPSDAATSHSAAVKVSPISHLTTTQFAALLKEIRILPYLHHPNLVTFYGYLISNSELKVFMELVRGANLEMILTGLRHNGRRFSLDDMLIIFFELSKGLKFLHDSNILHRDVKSAQVLVGHPELDRSGDKFRMTYAANSKLTFANPSQANQPQAHRKIVKAKRKFAAESTTTTAAATSTSPSVSSHTTSPTDLSLNLKPSSPSSPSFFANAQIKLCDFNIAIPVLESSSTEELDPHSPSSSLSNYSIEYVGTLRWVAPEVFRSSLPEGKHSHTSIGSSTNKNTTPTATSTAAAASTQSNASSQTSLSHAAVSSSSFSSTPSPSPSPSVSPSPSPSPSPAALRLDSGKRSDVWSVSNVLLELLTLHLPYENVPTEPELNEKLIRGERSDYQMWLDPSYWKMPEGEATSKGEQILETNAKQAWHSAMAAAIPVAGESAPSTASHASKFHSPSVVYESLVGLYLVGTSPNPADRPTMDDICRTLEWLIQQRREIASASGTSSTTMAYPSTSLDNDPSGHRGKKRRQSVETSEGAQAEEEIEGHFNKKAIHSNKNSRQDEFVPLPAVQ